MVNAKEVNARVRSTGGLVIMRCFEVSHDPTNLPSILRGSVHPLQDVALRTVLPSFSLSGISYPGGSFSLCDIISPSLYLSSA
ncbi:hypothetical protein ElyMa_005630900 [Elysia marginata]|uniref:Uncharacterized protein n=1 Tax=Elysia marginata TaxID=1093978 RepID=A0AAV4F8W6_9GAST|nr:hypothetical protein ElyMa_005630900 [Elysia marginata]